jgi:hypothetical protein
VLPIIYGVPYDLKYSFPTLISIVCVMLLRHDFEYTDISVPTFIFVVFVLTVHVRMFISYLKTSFFLNVNESDSCYVVFTEYKFDDARFATYDWERNRVILLRFMLLDQLPIT